MHLLLGQLGADGEMGFGAGAARPLALGLLLAGDHHRAGGKKLDRGAELVAFDRDMGSLEHREGKRPAAPEAGHRLRRALRIVGRKGCVKQHGRAPVEL